MRRRRFSRTDPSSEGELLDLARAGDRAAFGELFARFELYAAKVARSAGSRDVDETVAESFRRVLTAFENGAGPVRSFSSYLSVVVRTTCVDQSKRAAAAVLDDETVDQVSFAEVAHDVDPRVSQAFTSLPDNWQNAIWFVDVEGFAPRDAAPLLGLPTANAVSALMIRARAGLRAAYVELVRSEACVEMREGFVSGEIPQSHLQGCVKCSGVSSKLGMMTTRSAMVLGPAMVAFHGFPVTASVMPVMVSAVGAGAHASPRPPSRTVQAALAVGVAAVVAACLLVTAVGGRSSSSEQQRSLGAGQVEPVPVPSVPPATAAVVTVPVSTVPPVTVVPVTTVPASTVPVTAPVSTVPVSTVPVVVQASTVAPTTTAVPAPLPSVAATSTVPVSTVAPVTTVTETTVPVVEVLPPPAISTLVSPGQLKLAVVSADGSGGVRVLMSDSPVSLTGVDGWVCQGLACEPVPGVLTRRMTVGLPSGATVQIVDAAGVVLRTVQIP